jgi:hypothetical protein
VTEPERKVVEAEVVRDAEVHGVEHVHASRIETNRLFRRMLAPDRELEAARENLRGLRFRLWLWLAGFVVIGAGCFYGAAETRVVIWSAVLLIAGAGSALAAGVVGVILWAMGRLLPPPQKIQ